MQKTGAREGGGTLERARERHDDRKTQQRRKGIILRRAARETYIYVYVIRIYVSILPKKYVFSLWRLEQFYERHVCFWHVTSGVGRVLSSGLIINPVIKVINNLPAGYWFVRWPVKLIPVWCWNIPKPNNNLPGWLDYIIHVGYLSLNTKERFLTSSVHINEFSWMLGWMRLKVWKICSKQILEHPK